MYFINSSWFCAFDILSLSQILEGVQDRAVPVVPSAQVHATPTLYVLQLAFSQPAAEETYSEERRHIQLQSRRVLHEVRRDHRHLPRWRRVSCQPLLSLLTNALSVCCLRPRNSSSAVIEAEKQTVLGYVSLSQETLYTPRIFSPLATASYKKHCCCCCLFFY